MKAKYLALLAALSVTSAVQAADALTIDVHRDANCGCCKKWISHLEANGFKVVDHVESNMTAVKQRLGVAPRLASCHTAVIDGKFVEGHVPAAQVIELTKRCSRDAGGLPRHGSRWRTACLPGHWLDQDGF